ADLPVDVPTVDRAEFTPYPGTDPLAGLADHSGQQLAVPTGADAGADARAAVPAHDQGRIPTSPAVRRVGAVVLAALWPAALLINIVFGWNMWWAFLIPLFASGWIGYAFGLGKRP